MKQLSLNYDIKGDICEFKNNKFTDVTLMKGDVIVVTWTLCFDGHDLTDISFSKPKKHVGLSYA